MPLRILWMSDRMIGGYSAYSKVTAEVCSRLAALGHKVAHLPLGQANRMGKWVWKDILIYPSGRDSWGEDAAVRSYVDWKADIIMTLKDVWAWNSWFRYAVNWVPLVPVEHSPVSPSITSRLHACFRVAAISRFGQRELRRAGIDADYLPHGVRTDLYRPLERRGDCRRMFFFEPDEFVVGIVAMNRSRKMIPRMLRGYKMFLERNPDVKSHLMLWANVRPSTIPEEAPAGVADVGVNLLPEIMELGLGEAVRWPEERIIREGIPEWAGEDYRGGWDMVKLYNSFSVLLLCSGGEGFGLPLLEAQACGVPVVTTDYAAGPELVGAGLTVRAPDYVVLNTPGTRYALADVDEMADALTRIMNADSGKLRRRARRFAERYDWELVVERHFRPFLEECEAELRPMITREGVSTW